MVDHNANIFAWGYSLNLRSRFQQNRMKDWFIRHRVVLFGTGLYEGKMQHSSFSLVASSLPYAALASFGRFALWHSDVLSSRSKITAQNTFLAIDHTR